MNDRQDASNRHVIFVMTSSVDSNALFCQPSFVVSPQLWGMPEEMSILPSAMLEAVSKPGCGKLTGQISPSEVSAESLLDIPRRVF